MSCWCTRFRFLPAIIGINWGPRRRLRELLLRRDTRVPDELIEHIQLDGLREEPAFANTLRELDLDRRFVAAFSDRPEIVTRQLPGLPPAEHALAARDLRNQGYLPRVICAAHPNTGDQL